MSIIIKGAVSIKGTAAIIGTSGGASGVGGGTGGGGTYYVHDMFTGADETFISGSSYMPDVGGAYTRPYDVNNSNQWLEEGAFKIMNNQAEQSDWSSYSTSRVFNTVVPPTGDHVVGIDVVITEVQSWFVIELLAHAKPDMSNFMRGYLEISSRGDVWTSQVTFEQDNVGYGPTPPVDVTPGTHRFELKCVGDTYSIYWDSILIHAETTTGEYSPGVANGMAGFSMQYGGDKNTIRLDNFTVTPV